MIEDTKMLYRRNKIIKNRCLFIIIVALFSIDIHILAQDTINTRLNTLVSHSRSNVIVPSHFDYPPQFLGTNENVIHDIDHKLDPIFRKLYFIHKNQNKDTLRILHIGDSHVHGKIFPNTIGDLIVGTFRTVVYTSLSINGATCHIFANSKKMIKVFEAKPDIIIISFGTNESYGRSYIANSHYKQLDELITNINAKLPDIPLLLTTPPGSYLRYHFYKYRTLKTKRQRVRIKKCKMRYCIYDVNPNNEKAASTICKYAQDHLIAYWNLYEVVGGKERACQNWVEASLMRRDHVHFTADGYRLQGNLLFQAFIKAYDDYVSR